MPGILASIHQNLCLARHVRLSPWVNEPRPVLFDDMVSDSAASVHHLPAEEQRLATLDLTRSTDTRTSRQLTAGRNARSVVALCLVLLFSPGIDAGADKEATRREDRRTFERMEQASELLAGAGDFHINSCDAAMPIYQEVAAKYPRSFEAGEAKLRRALCLAESDNRASAVAALHDLVIVRPGTEHSVRALLMYASLFEEDGHREIALAYCRRAHADSPQESKWRAIAIGKATLLEKEIQTTHSWAEHLAQSIMENLIARLQLPPIVDGLLTRNVTVFVLRVLIVIACFVVLAALEVLPSSRRTSIPSPVFCWTPMGAVSLILVLLLVDLMIRVAVHSVGLTAYGTGQLSLSALKTIELADGLIFPVTAAAAVLYSRSAMRLVVPSIRELRRVVLGVVIVVGAWVSLAIIAALAGGDAFGRSGAEWYCPYSAVGAAAYYLVVAVGEEALYRGALYSTFKSRILTTYAVLLSATLFSLVHLFPFADSVLAFVVGGVAARLVERSGRLGGAILFHWLVNVIIYVVACS